MANLIQGTVVNIGGNPQPTALNQAFLTSGIIMQEATIASSQVAGTQITYYSGPFSNTIFYVTETVSALVAAANTGTTSQVQVTVYEINGDSLPVPVSFGFPASGVVLKESVHGSVNTILTCAGVTYGVSETEASIVTAANVGGGGGGGWALTGTTTLTGPVTIDGDGNSETFTTSDGTNIGNLGLSATADDTYIGWAKLDNTSGTILQFGDDATLISFGTGTLKYNADYSANYTARSLIDKGYADGLVAGLPSLSAANTWTNTNQFNKNVTIGQGSYIAGMPTITTLNYDGQPAYGSKGLRLHDVFNGGDGVIQLISGASFYFTNAAGTPGTITAGSIGNGSTGNSIDFSGSGINFNGDKVGIGGVGATSAKLEIDSTTQGLLPPRMTTTQKNAISSPAEGLVVYDTSLHKLCVRAAAAWETITSV